MLTRDLATGGFTGEAIEDLTGGVTTELFSSDILDKDQFWDGEIKKVNESFLFSCSTGYVSPFSLVQYFLIVIQKRWENDVCAYLTLKIHNRRADPGGCCRTFDKWQESDTASQNGARGGIIRMHAYSIMDAVEKRGQRLVKVRNPWGSDEWRGAWSDGSEQWTPEWMQILDHKFGDVRETTPKILNLC